MSAARVTRGRPGTVVEASEGRPRMSAARVTRGRPGTVVEASEGRPG
jgi:hypothetical protein